MKTRRQFIQDAAVSAAAFAMASATGRSTFAATKEIGADPITKLRSELAGGLLLPGDPDYEKTRRLRSQNPRTDQRPALIARCARPDDVARSIAFARGHELTIAVRAGGHSFLGWSSCDDGLMIDLSPLKGISIDPTHATARVGAGVTARELVHATSLHGLAPVLGQCGSVGVAGLTLGGGLGWLSGKYGAACDNLVAASLVTTTGDSIGANAETNQDLFWAIRGGGGNFGVATSLEFRLHAVKEVVAGGLTYRIRDARAVLRFYRDFMADAPDEVQGLAYLTPANDGALNVVLVCTGDLDRGERQVEKFRDFLAPARDTVQRRAFADTFNMPPSNEFVPTSFDANKGAYIARLSDEAIDVALECFARAPRGCAIGFDHYMHGMVCRVAPSDTAFELRAAGGVHVWISPSWNDAADTATFMGWADDTWMLLQPYSAERTYANYMSKEGEGVAKSVYGLNYPRLAALKRKYDPNNVLRRNQNVLPAPA